MVNLLYKTLCGDLMKHILKLISPLLIIAILFSSCTFNSSEKTLEQIKTLIVDNEFNTCLKLVKELDSEEKAAINNEVCNIVINKFIELRTKTKIDETNIFDLSLINTSFAEKCQKLWNIISEFAINEDYELYNECVNLRYYSEMIDFTRYCDIYSLAKKANNSGYLDDLSVALYEYENKGNNSHIKLIFDEIRNINYSNFDPQQYLVSDFRNAHDKIVNAINNLEDGFNANDSTTVAKAINSLHNALDDILYITDILTAVNSMQKIIYNTVSKDNLYAPFDNDIKITKRDYTTSMSFSLDLIFGGVEQQITPENNNSESTTIKNDNTISLDDTIKIVTNAINKTKAFTGEVAVTLTQTRNIHLTDFETDSAIADAENLIKSQLNQTINQSNGTGRQISTFSSGTNGKQSLNSFIPPANNTVTITPDAIDDYTCIKGSGGYIITLTLKPELVKKGSNKCNLSSIVNTFEFDTSEKVKDFNTSYSATKISLVVNNSDRLIEMEYSINGISNCEFEENNGANEYKAQFTFKNTYKYEFKY